MTEPDKWRDRLEQAAHNPQNPLVNDTVIVRRDDLRRAMAYIDELVPSEGDIRRIADAG